MWWLFILIPILLIVLLMFLKVRLCLSYENDLSVKVKVLFFNLALFPKTKKNPRPKNYTLKALKRRQDKLNKKSLKAQKKQSKKATAPQSDGTAQQDKNAKLKEILALIRLILDNVMSPFGRYLKVEILKMHVKVGSADPAKTALIYGGVCQAVSYIVELLSNLTNVDIKNTNSISVEPDFFEGKTEANINITLGLRVWHALSLAIKFFMAYLKKNSTAAQPTEQK